MASANLQRKRVACCVHGLPNASSGSPTRRYWNVSAPLRSPCTRSCAGVWRSSRCFGLSKLRSASSWQRQPPGTLRTRSGAAGSASSAAAPQKTATGPSPVAPAISRHATSAAAKACRCIRLMWSELRRHSRCETLNAGQVQCRRQRASSLRCQKRTRETSTY